MTSCSTAPQSKFQCVSTPSSSCRNLPTSYFLVLVLNSPSRFPASLRTPAPAPRRSSHISHLGWRWDDEDDTAILDSGTSFEYGVLLFNRGDYYQCHDVLENLWNRSEEPKRSVLHGILQCSVGLYHLLNKNHRGAMVEVGEGLTKLRRQKFTAGPFYHFEQEVSAVLDFIYNTQLEHAACAEDICLTMDGSEQSYQLLGDFAAGEHLYEIRRDDNNQCYIFFISQYGDNFNFEDGALTSLKVQVPLLKATSDDLHGLR